MQMRIQYVEKVPKPVKVGGLLTINPGFFVTYEYEARERICEQHELDAVMTEMIKRGIVIHRVSAVEPNLWGE